ncbi:MAG: hypothetical protein IPK79_11235 [Vampirovibrionales bacterium]|nr:hypothetical protein [Vampirovibrionales bacterium]
MDLMTSTGAADALAHQLKILTTVGWIALIPISILLIPLLALLAIILGQVAMLLWGVLEFLPLARYEIYPILKNARQISARAEALSEKTMSGVEGIGRGYQKSVETAGRGVNKLRSATRHLGSAPAALGGAAGMLGAVGKGLWRAFKPGPKTC